MLDMRFIRENADLVAEKASQKGYKVDVKKLILLDDNRKKLLTEIEKLRAQRNELSAGRQKPGGDQMQLGRNLKASLASLEEQLKPLEKEYQKILLEVPNIIPDDTPLGGEDSRIELGKWGDTSDKGYVPLDHLAWGEKRSLIDFGRGAKVAGNKFFFLKGALVELELAAFQLGIQIAGKHGFVPITVPHLVNTRTLEGAGFSARGAEKQIYKVEDEDLNLIATAEIPLTGLHSDEILDEKNLPLLYAGLSPAYRVEGGAYGKHSRGLFRTHQFNKLELYILCKPAQSEDWHQKLLGLEEEICRLLEIPYRVVRIAAGDLGAPAYKKYDIEYWSAVDKGYFELMSCSNVTDYQARRLNIRLKDSKGKINYVHTLNATAAAMSRITIALIENHQTKDLSVQVPKALQPYFAGRSSF